MTAYFCLGIASPYTQWCEQVLSALLAASGRPAQMVAANTIDEFATAALRTDAPNLVVQVRTCAPGLRAALEQGGKRFLLVQDTPFAACRLPPEGDTKQLTEAVKAISGGCAAMVRMSSMPDALCLHSRSDTREAVARAMAIADWFDLAIEPAIVARILSDIPLPVGHSAEDGLHNLRAFTPETRAMMEGALQPYVDWHAGKGIGRFTWTRQLFVEGDPPHAPVSGTIDLTGRVRLLMVGPHIALPPGAWTATLSLALSREAAGISYVVDVVGGQSLLGRMHMSAKGAGYVESSAMFSVGDEDQPVWFGIFNERAAIDGHLTLGQVIVSPVPSAWAEIPHHISATLNH